MIFGSRNTNRLIGPAKTTILLSVVFFFALLPGQAAAQQKRFSRAYPAGSDVQVTLMNRTGTVIVEGWDRPEISILATMESPAANIVPQNLSGTITINLLKDNHGRDIGAVNFTIRVPFTSLVNIETRVGNLSVSNMRTGYIRAHISSEGDITLTNIVAGNVAAENGIGDIFYDGEFVDGGNYRFKSMSGRINLRIPPTSSFKFMATAPSTRGIRLGPFGGGESSHIGDGRRIVGQANGGRSTLYVTSMRGTIDFIRR